MTPLDGRVARAIDTEMNLGVLPSVLEGGAFDFSFSCSSRIRRNRSTRLRDCSTLNFDHSIKNT